MNQAPGAWGRALEAWAKPQAPGARSLGHGPLPLVESHERPAAGFWEIRTDNLTAAGVMNREIEWEEEDHECVPGWIEDCEIMVELVRGRWLPGTGEAGWFFRVPRSRNAVADAVAKWAVQEKQIRDGWQIR